MDVRDLINKEKLRCDNIISIALIGSFLLLFVFFRLIVIMSLIVYPLSSLFLYGIYKTYKSLVKKDRPLFNKILNFLLGIGSIIFSSFFLTFIFTPPVPTSYIIIFLSIPSFLIGSAAILKGSLVHVYSRFYRNMNIVVGLITIICSFLSPLFAEDYFLFSLIILLCLLTINGIFRAGLYLSEYDLSMWNLKNFRLVFFIMDNLQLINLEEERDLN